MFNKWYANNATNLSHVLMDGGKLSVPFDSLNEFYDLYIEAVRTGKKIYVVEQKSETYNFFVDIDYKDKDPLGIDDIHDICKVICQTVRLYSPVECLISVALPKPCGSLMKTGVHLNWSDLVVDQASAIALREHILIALSKFRGGTDWNEIIDAAVYGSIARKSKGSGSGCHGLIRELSMTLAMVEGVKNVTKVTSTNFPTYPYSSTRKTPFRR